MTEDYVIPGWRNHTPVAGVGLQVTKEHLPIYEETCAVLGFVPLRVITDMRLLEVSVVTWPANPHASIRLFETP